MQSTETQAEFWCSSSGATLSGTDAGAGVPLVCLHGLTATRRYVLMGSRLLERNGYRVISYDARGHGTSSAASQPSAYEYSDLVADLRAVIDELDVGQAILCGSSMGAHAALSFALSDPARVRALVVVTPSYAGEPATDAELYDWDRLAQAIERDGVQGFMDAYSPRVDPRFAESVMRFTRQRLEAHADPTALADPLRVVPRSRPFGSLESLRALEVPVLLIASHDGPDPGHPQWVAQAYADCLPQSELAIEAEGKSPLAWQGAQLSRTITGFVERWGLSGG